MSEIDMDNAEERDVYGRIFAEVRNPSDVRGAIARAVRQLRAAMEKEDNCAVAAAHVRSLADIDPAALAVAYAMAEKTCTYWPSPGQIRELAGWSEESRGGAALEWVFRYLEKHDVLTNPAIFHVRSPKLEKSLPKALPETPNSATANNARIITKFRKRIHTPPLGHPI